MLILNQANNETVKHNKFAFQFYKSANPLTHALDKVSLTTRSE